MSRFLWSYAFEWDKIKFLITDFKCKLRGLAEFWENGTYKWKLRQFFGLTKTGNSWDGEKFDKKKK